MNQRLVRQVVLKQKKGMVDSLSLFFLWDFLRDRESRWFPYRIDIIDSGTRWSPWRCVAGFASGGSRSLWRNYPAFVSGDETLMVLRALSRAIRFVFGGDRWLKYRMIGLVSFGFLGSARGVWRVRYGDCGPELGWDLESVRLKLSDAYDWRSLFQ